MLAGHIARFSRVLRDAGLSIGPDRVLVAVQAVEQVGVERRADVHAALAAVMLDSHEQQALFDLAFDAIWRAPDVLADGLPPASQGASTRGSPESRRLAEALAAARPASRAEPAGAAPRNDKAGTFSALERLHRADVDSMSAAEFALAKTLAEELPLPVEPVARRRHELAPGRRSHSRIDLRATMQRMARQPHTLLPVFTRPRRELPNLVVLLDISGSMDRYARLLLHYVHGLARRGLRVHTFTFGTRLTDITRSLRHRDADRAMQAVGDQVADWNGGTRIAASLDAFNRVWARRLLASNAAVLLVTDGLDRDPHGDLSRAAAQLRRHAHRVVWLNPLLRFEGFEPRAAGVRALLPHVHRFLPVHNLASLAGLGRALRAPAFAPSRLLA